MSDQKCPCGYVGVIEWADSWLCGDCAGRQVRQALLAMQSTDCRMLTAYYSEPDFVRRYVLPAVSQFLTERDNAGRGRCSVIGEDGVICFGVSTHGDIDVSSPWGPDGLGDFRQHVRHLFCEKHWDMWRETELLHIRTEAQRHAVTASRLLIEDWARRLHPWLKTKPQVGGDNRLRGYPLLPLTTKDVETVWPSVIKNIGGYTNLPAADVALKRCAVSVLASELITYEFSSPEEIGYTQSEMRSVAEAATRHITDLRGRDIKPYQCRIRVSSGEGRPVVTTMSRPRSERPDVRYQVYRLWDASGGLLYVGQTIEGTKRLRAHEKEKHWWGDVSSVTWQNCASKEEMDEVELQAIREENPRYNVAGRPRREVAV